MIGATSAFYKIKSAIEQPTFYKVIQGGMSAGKTYAIICLLIGYAESYPDSLLTVVGMSYPHLKHGTIRDFQKIMKETKRWDEAAWSKVGNEYRFKNGSVLEFMSVDKMGAHGPRRDVLFVNEANGINYDTFDQLASRTRDFAIIDYNPSSRFWAHDELVYGTHKTDTSFLVVTYADNEALGERERANIESHRPAEGAKPSNWWTVYGLGQIGSLEGNVYSGWIEKPVEEVKTGRLIRYGLDFGFSNDETALVALYEHEDGSLGVSEELYQKGLLGSQYGPKLDALGVDRSVLIIADSARPEIIAEIQKADFRCIGCEKGAGSILKGIDLVSQRQIEYSGADLKREYLSYAWRKRRDGQRLDEPEDGNDHLMDALRYAVTDLNRPKVEYGGVSF